MNLKIATFNLFQFCNPNFSFYNKKDKLNPEIWEDKKEFIKEIILKSEAHIIGFQEVFSQNDLKELLNSISYKYFICVEKPIFDESRKTFTSTTLALASKFPIKDIYNCTLKNDFSFARKPIIAHFSIENKDFLFYLCHLKSNRLNEFEYSFTKDSSLEDKQNKLNLALKNNYSDSLKQRINEAKALHFDIRSRKIPTILAGDLNDKEFSVTIEALTNRRFYNKNLEKDSYILKDSYNLAPKKIYNPHPEFKGVKRVPTSYFIGYGNVLDFIFVSKEFKVLNHNVLDNHLQKNKNGTLNTSDHALVVCEVTI